MISMISVTEEEAREFCNKYTSDESFRNDITRHWHIKFSQMLYSNYEVVDRHGPTGKRAGDYNYMKKGYGYKHD